MMERSQRVAAIRDKLTAAFAPQHLMITDDSQKHAGHASASGGGHFNVQVVADAFAGKSLIQRHRMVFAAVDELMQSGDIHALSIDARSPDESTQ